MARKNKTALVVFSLLMLSSVSMSQVFMDADSAGDAYRRIQSMGYVIEIPDCKHPVRHITEQQDNQLKKYVFAFTLHKDIDDDRCKNFDRQRCEMTTDTIGTPDFMRGSKGGTHTYRWKFKLDAGFQPSPNFCHIHQLKAGNGPEAGAPIITITPRYGTPDKLQVIFSAPRGQTGSGPVKEVDLAPFKGTWIEAYERVKYDDHGTIDLVLRRVSDDSLLLSYRNDDIATWRPGSTWTKPKFGLYRSLRSPEYLRDETVLFADFYLAEGTTVVSPSAPSDLSASARSATQIDLHWSSDALHEGQFRIDRSTDEIHWSYLATTGGSTRSYSDTSLAASTSYHYRVRAENTFGNSDYCAAVTVEALKSK
jgi:hypothetical protein